VRLGCFSIEGVGNNREWLMIGVSVRRIAAACAATIALLLGLTTSAGAADYKLLTDEQIIALLNGATLGLKNINTQDETYYRLRPLDRAGQHGKLDVKNLRAREVESGIWWVEEEQFCLLHQHVVNVRKRCFAVARDGDDVRFIETRYELRGQHVEKPHQWVPSAQMFRAPQSAGNYHLLNDEELVALLNRATLNIKLHDSPREILIHFQPVEKPGQHGVMDSHPPKGGGIYRGTWWVEDEQFCVFWQNLVSIRKRCFAVARDGDNIRVIETRREQPGHVVERPHEWVPSAQIFRAVGG
jgi:hypothetical protein